jgi:hypothetical protein
MSIKSTDALDERLNGLENMSRDAFSRIEALVSHIDKRLRDIETSALADVAVQKARLDAAWKKLDEHANIIAKQDDFIQKLRPIYAALIWLSVSIGGLVIGLLWALLTHQIEIK